MRKLKEHPRAEAHVGCAIVLCHRAHGQPRPNFRELDFDKRQAPLWSPYVCFRTAPGAAAWKAPGHALCLPSRASTILQPLCVLHTHRHKSGGSSTCALSSTQYLLAPSNRYLQPCRSVPGAAGRRRPWPGGPRTAPAQAAGMAPPHSRRSTPARCAPAGNGCRHQLPWVSLRLTSVTSRHAFILLLIMCLLQHHRSPLHPGLHLAQLLLS